MTSAQAQRWPPASKRYYVTSPHPDVRPGGKPATALSRHNPEHGVLPSTRSVKIANPHLSTLGTAIRITCLLARPKLKPKSTGVFPLCGVSLIQVRTYQLLRCLLLRTVVYKE